MSRVMVGYYHHHSEPPAMKTYVAQLQAIVAETEAAHRDSQERTSQQAAKTARDRLVPLETRLKRLLDEIPPQVKAVGLPILELRLRLAGRARRNRGFVGCQIGELANEMRRVGWRRVRDWTSREKGYCSRWFPPD
jgi:hypothetical protein